MSVFRLWPFGRRVVGPAAGARPASPGAYGEALQAGWVPPLPEVRNQDRPASLASAEKSDIAAFLARFYLNQRG